MSKRPFPYDEATEVECLAKRVRLIEKLAAVNTRLRVLAPPPDQEEGPACSSCGVNSVVRVSKTEKNMNKKFWSCPNRCNTWIGWVDAPVLVLATCAVCKKSRKMGLNGETITEEMKEDVKNNTYMCQTCKDDVEF